MNARLLILTIISSVSFTAYADEKIAVLNVGSEVYSNVTVTGVSATDVFFTYSGGMGNAKLKQLSPELQKHFNYDPQKARAGEQKLADNKTKYHDQLLHQPAVKPPSEEIDPGSRHTHATPAAWQEDLPGALSQAQSEGKLVLLDFTGSDWCPWCIKFDSEVLTTEQFAGYARSKLVLVKVDFPEHTPQDPGVKAANSELKAKFRVSGFPTYVLLAADGHELGRQEGYQAGGPSAFISELNGFEKQ